MSNMISTHSNIFRRWELTQGINVITATNLAELVARGVLITDPIPQRPPVPSESKLREIISALLRGMPIGMIIIRDISGHKKLQELYKGAKYLVIDGGHRCRALHDYVTNKFPIGGEYYRKNPDMLDNIQIVIQSIECDERTACEIFRSVNNSTPVNRMEEIMANEISPVAKEIRLLTGRVREYDNMPHELFASTMNHEGMLKSDWFGGPPNPRRTWDEYVALAMVTLQNDGYSDVNWNNIKDIIDSEKALPKKILDKTKEFLDFVLRVHKNRGSQKSPMNGDIFHALFCVWMGFYHYKSHDFKINDWEGFTREFMKTYSDLTGIKSTKYNSAFIPEDPKGKNKCIDSLSEREKNDLEQVSLKEYMRKNLKNHFAHFEIRRRVFNLFMKYFDDRHVTFLDANRSITRSEREEILASQGYVCAIDGKPLGLDDSVWAHDIPWAKGGSTNNGYVVRKEYNTEMGQLTIDEYRKAKQIA